ncbi:MULTISPECIES: NCS2 family permease [unclassified Dysgonomonas]|uniref:NCS2 family permease n=1 Tax=unclassified Dysgonomonas TaxID=2630389 RepID=UPI0006811991|nr:MULTISPECIES: NCS2 family permease [unclassified Dysgonomonas]MBD8348012.1 NCS2 family permease [Dysgonomonas sp. HGC4]MBF0575687.1 NCS2 family permease [Dysgonomonas sp. GY617]
MNNMLEKIFKLKENNTTVRTELFAGLITFLTMSYILVVNPNILGEAHMDRAAVFTATVLGSIIATLFMAFFTNLPVAQAPGMGLNNFFAFTVVLTMGYTWQFALTAVFIEGIIFILLTFFNVRELIVKSIPRVLKEAIPVGVGLFITLVGLKSAGVVVGNDATLVSLGDMANPHVWIALAGVVITGALLALNVNGAILIGIVAATIGGVFAGVVHFPEGNWVSLPPSLAPTFAQFEWDKVLSFDMALVVFTFLFVNLFDTVGTLIGVVSKAGLTDSEGNFPQIKKALFADALGTTVGAVLGTSPITAYVESSSGVAAGGRTGLTSVSTAFMFVLALFFAPLFLIVPASATSPALIVVGLFMISAVAKINFNDITESLPAFVTLIFMPFTYSIAQGIVFGILTFFFVKILSGRYKDVSAVIYVLAILFIIKLGLDAAHIWEKM